MFIKNKLTGAIFDVDEKYYNEILIKNTDIEKIDEPKKNKKPTLGGE